ncbi:Kiwa anti-phage protein KwaB-like domain-containing protein, partial [uncultured Secundilactobacillus sp.]|uniref:Kiwa anti-phage protein KwaB-like domain-containing protein n=1 Tax=uncultured Secundilactobacillus sp. TaxID=2813935 RepID=UPI00258A0F12
MFNLNEAIDILEKSDTTIALSFIVVDKSSNKEYTYKGFSVGLSDDSTVKAGLLKPIAEYLKKYEKMDARKYDPITQKAECIEVVDSNEISEYPSFIDSIGENPITDYKKRMYKIDFYVLTCESDSGERVYLVRKFDGLKTLKRKVYSVIDGSLNQIDDEVIGIDNKADLVIMGEKIGIITHNSLKSLFNIRYAMQKRVKKILTPVKNSGKVDEYDKFERMIRSDGRYTSEVINMKNHGRDFSKPLDNESKVLKTIKDFNLESKVEYDSDSHKIILSKTEDIHALLRLLSDYYYKTTQNELLGIVDQ